MTHIEEYKQLREKLLDAHGFILGHATNEEIHDVARELDVLENRKIVLTNELEKDAMMDYYIYRKTDTGKSKIAYYAELEENREDEDEKLYQAMAESETSLYEVVEADPKEKTVKLKDVFNPSEVVTIVDLAMSETINKDVLLFTRLIHLESFSMTSGLIFTFRHNHLEYLRKRSRKHMKKINAKNESDQRFITFFQMNRRDGVPFMTEDVE